MSGEKQPLENYGLSLAESFKPDENFEKENPQISSTIDACLYHYSKILFLLLRSKGAEVFYIRGKPVNSSRAVFFVENPPKQQDRTSLAFRKLLADINAYQGDYDTILVSEITPNGLPALSIDLQNGWKILEKTACLNPLFQMQVQIDFAFLQALSERLETTLLELNTVPGYRFN